MSRTSTTRRSSHTRRLRTDLRCTELESRLTPAAAALTASASLASGAYAIGPDAGDPGLVVAYQADGTEALRGEPYGPGFTNGIRVALGDIDGDGVQDVVTAPGPGAPPDVLVYSGRTGGLIREFLAYEATFLGGVYVGAADLNGDGKAEVIVSPDEGGGPRVRVLDGASVAGGGGLTAVADFLAINDPNFRGGARLGLGDLNRDGVADLVVGAGFGGGPRVVGYDGAALGRGGRVSLFGDFYAYEGSLRNGVYVAVGDLNGDGAGDLVFGAGPGGAPRVRVIDLTAVEAGGGFANLDALPRANLANFYAGDTSSRLGVRVGVGRDNGGSAAVVAADVATHSARVYRLDGTAGPELNAPPGSRGVFVATPASDRTADPVSPLPAAPNPGPASPQPQPTSPSPDPVGTNETPTATLSPGIYSAVATDYSSEIEARAFSSTFTGALWYFYQDGSFSVSSATGAVVTSGLWADHGDFAEISTYGTLATSLNAYNLAGRAARDGDGSVLVRADFASQGNFFSLTGITFGTLVSRLVPLGGTPGPAV